MRILMSLYGRDGDALTVHVVVSEARTKIVGRCFGFLMFLKVQ
jgi:hypothetical protein